MPYIAFKELHTVASRGNPEKLVFPYDVSVRGNMFLDKFIKALDITPPQENPQWWLVCI